MRSRIEKRLQEECLNNPDDTALALQRHRLGSAKICTIDSFCIELVRENFEKLNISPDFKIGEESTLNSVNEGVASAIINRYLENEDSVFSQLLDLIGAEEDEQNFLSFLLDIYKKVQHLPFPEGFYKSLSEFYSNGVFNETSIWAQYAFENATEFLEGLYNSLDTALKSFETFEDLYLKYSPAFLSALESISVLEEYAATKDWNAFYNALHSFELKPLPAKTRNAEEPDEITDAKDYYKEIPKLLNRLNNLFYADKEFINLQYKHLYKPLALLSDILIELDRSIFEKYLEINTLTFHNVEHLALQLLCYEENGEIVLKDNEEITDNFDAVMVDEFQDVNDLQNLLFNILSLEGKNLFVVGDIKQSIYGFRGSNPKNFLNKKNNCVPYKTDDESVPKKIILGNNFRCKREVCEFVNYFFELFMTEQTGIIDYNDEEKLIPAAVFPEIKAPCVELDIIDTGDSAYSTIELEALRIADYIKQAMDEGNIIRVDNETLRQAEYSDFVILLRSAKSHGPIIAEILKAEGIPVNYNVENFTENTEVSTFLRLLSVIDNPQNDVDLLCVLMSPIFRFTAEELAKMRCEKKSGSLYSALITSASSGNSKAADFIKNIEEYRVLSVTMPLSSFITYLLETTDFLNIVSVLPDGKIKRANLLLITQYAEQFAAEGVNTVGAFAKKILKLSSGSLKAAGSSGGNAVKIMSIHKSKGLQFPICIVAHTTGAFNSEHKRSNTLYTTDFGIGFKYYDEELKEKLTTVSHEAISDRIGKDLPQEELRLLYVAMTRTQDRLVFTAAIKNVESTLKKHYLRLKYADFKINNFLFLQTNSYADWLITALMLHPMGKALRPAGYCVLPSDNNCEFTVKFINSEDLSLKADEPSFKGVINNEVVTAAKENFAYKYPFEEILKLESKASVSKLANSAESAKYAFKNEPEFMCNGGLTASGKGTAMHKCMEYFDFAMHSDIEAEIERLYEWQYLSETERNSLNIEALKTFFASDIFSRMMNSSLLKREMRFLTEVNAKKISPGLDDRFSNEKIIVQGAVDVCFAEADGIVILDFKTDRVNSPDALKKAYSEQLNIYASACEKIFNMPVKQKIIYSFSLGSTIEI